METPSRLADFEIIRRLGAGGMAEVFLAKRRGAEGTFKLLVVKRILPQHVESARFRSMFAEEAQLATRLNHPNIVQVYDFQDYGEEGQLLSMEYVEGPDLRKLLRGLKAQQARLPPYVAAFIVGEVAKGLHYAHMRKDERGAPLDIVHRDVSHQNILLSFEGAVKIADFGIATANLFREEPGLLMGKTSFMSPEQARAERVDRRTDIYSLGVVMHELLTGRPLHGAAEGAELLEAVRSGHVEPPSTFARGVPSELEAIAMRALSRAPEDRYQTARDMAVAISRALFASQDVVDSQVLEGVIERVVGREHTSPGVDAPATSASSSVQLSADSLGRLKSRGDTVTGEDGAERRWDLKQRVGREVRHVAIVSLKLHHGEALAQAIGYQPAKRVAERLRTTLDELAFKWGARWSWEQGVGQGEAFDPLVASAARAVVGLMANPTRAASDAASLAVYLHEAIGGVSDDLPVPIQASIGIARGVAAGKRDGAGHLIQHQLQKNADYLAHLLCEQAPPGTTCAAGGLYRMVRREFVWSDLPTVQIPDADQRDLPRNIRVYQLERPKTREERVNALPQATTDLVGRDTELAELHGAYHHAVSSPAGRLGRVTARVVVGEMGIGKSVLVSTFLADLPPDARILRMECTPARSEIPFAAVGEWVRELTSTRQDQPIDEVVQQLAELLGDFAKGQFGAEIVRRLAELVTGNTAHADDDAEVAHHRRLITAGLRRFFARVAVESPFVVMVDGLQWCDRSSLELLTQLLSREDPLPILALLVTRPSERVNPFIQGIVRVDIHGLSAENQVRLLQTHLGCQAGVRAVCADLISKAAGNPFFLIEMVDALLERGVFEIREAQGGVLQLVQVERALDKASALPSTLEQLIADRLNELPADEHSVVDWLAVSGGPLSIADLKALAGVEIGEAISRVCARAVCDERQGSVDVHYPLTRDVAYLGLESGERARMHRLIAEHLVAQGAARGMGAVLVARHFSKGKNFERAGTYYMEAAAAARAGYQMQLSTRYYRRALALLPQEDTRRLQAEEALEAACRVQGRWRERRQHLMALRKLAKSSNHPEWIVLALLRTARFDLDEGRLAKGLEVARQAEQIAVASASPVLEVQAQALVAETLRDLGDMQGALAACDRAIISVQHPKVPVRRRAEVLRTRGTLLRRVGRVHEAVEAHAEAIAVFRQVGARRQEARTKNALAYAMFVLGRFEDAIALAIDSIRIDLSIGGRFQMAKTLSNIGQSYGRLGDLPRAQAYLARARQAHERYGDQDGRADTFLCSAFVMLESGDISDAENMLGDAGALIAATGSAYDSIHEKIIRALLALWGEDYNMAVVYAFDARQLAEAQAYVAFHFYAMAIEALARVEIGEHHTGILLATTALGAIGTIQGSEYGIETRALCCEALRKASSSQTEELQARAAEYVQALLGFIRNEAWRTIFLQRKYVKELLGEPKEAEQADAHVLEAAGQEQLQLNLEPSP